MMAQGNRVVGLNDALKAERERSRELSEALEKIANLNNGGDLLPDYALHPHERLARKALAQFRNKQGDAE